MAKEARRVGNELEAFVGTSLRDFTLDLSEDLQRSTPVDSGFAQSSWRPKSGAAGRESPEHPDSYGGGRIAAAELQRTIQQDHEAAFKTNKNIEDKFLLNNANYINELNAGKSPQAPAGFVERVISDHTSRGT